jgi:hypothetical protein
LREDSPDDLRLLRHDPAIEPVSVERLISVSETGGEAAAARPALLPTAGLVSQVARVLLGDHPHHGRLERIDLAVLDSDQADAEMGERVVEVGHVGSAPPDGFGEPPSPAMRRTCARRTGVWNFAPMKGGFPST